MAATRLIPLNVNKGKTAAASIKDRIEAEIGVLPRQATCGKRLV